MSTRLAIQEIELTEDGNMLITKIAVIDGNTGEHIRIAKITKQLIDFMKIIEIEIDDYFAVQTMMKKNPAVKKLVKEFNLIL